MKAPFLHYKAFTQSHIWVKSQSSLTPVHGGTWRTQQKRELQHSLEKLHPNILFRVTHCLLEILSQAPAGLKGRGTLTNLD